MDRAQSTKGAKVGSNGQCSSAYATSSSVGASSIAACAVMPWRAPTSPRAQALSHDGHEGSPYRIRRCSATSCMQAVPSKSTRIEAGVFTSGGAAELDRAASRADEHLEREHVLAELGHLAEQQLPSPAGPTDPELLDPRRRHHGSAAQTRVGMGIV